MGKPFPKATGSSSRIHRGLSPGVPKLALVEPAETPGSMTLTSLLHHFFGQRLKVSRFPTLETCTGGQVLGSMESYSFLPGIT